jgi:hypothetical protein
MSRRGRRPGTGILRTTAEHADEGAVAILVAILMTSMLGLAALVIDIGLAQDNVRTAQGAADSAALAAGTTLKQGHFGQGLSITDPQLQGKVVTAVQAYATANAGTTATDWSTCTDPDHLQYTPDGVDTCISYDATQARVVVPTKSSPSIFGGALGSGPVGVSRTAIAQWAHADPAPCWLCVQGLSVQSQSPPVALNANDGTVTLNSGDVRVGTSGPATLSVTTGHVTATTGQITYTDTTQLSGSGYTPLPTPGAALTSPAPPPTAPSSASGPIDPKKDAVGPGCSPGVYVHITACQQFDAGIYVITGQNLFANGPAVATLGPSTFYLTCSDSTGTNAQPCAPGQVGGSITWAGPTADLNLDGPAPGMDATIVVDPQDAAPLNLLDTSSLSHDSTARYVVNIRSGGIYAPGSALSVTGRNQTGEHGSGGPDICQLNVTGRIVVDTLTMTGVNSQLTQSGSPMTSPPTEIRPRLVQ